MQEKVTWRNRLFMYFSRILMWPTFMFGVRCRTFPYKTKNIKIPWEDYICFATLSYINELKREWNSSSIALHRIHFYLIETTCLFPNKERYGDSIKNINKYLNCLHGLEKMTSSVFTSNRYFRCNDVPLLSICSINSDICSFVKLWPNKTPFMTL